MRYSRESAPLSGWRRAQRVSAPQRSHNWCVRRAEEALTVNHVAKVIYNNILIFIKLVAIPPIACHFNEK